MYMTHIVRKFSSPVAHEATFLAHCKQFAESHKVALCVDVFNGSLFIARNFMLRSNMFDFYCSLLNTVQ
jgi:hypothetical protein